MPVTPAAAMTARLARLLLLVCTVLGVAALHTVGHAAVTGLDHHSRATAVTDSTTFSIVPAVTPGEHGGCDGDGCTHQAAAPTGSQDTSRWWEVCLAVLTVLAVGVLGTRLWTTGTATLFTLKHRRRRSAAAVRPFGLAVTAVTVIRT